MSLPFFCSGRSFPPLDTLCFHETTPHAGGAKPFFVQCPRRTTNQMLCSLNRGRSKYGNEIPWQCSWQSLGELSGPGCLEAPYFQVLCAQVVLNCSCECSFELCHSQSLLAPDKIPHAPLQVCIHWYYLRHSSEILSLCRLFSIISSLFLFFFWKTGT